MSDGMCARCSGTGRIKWELLFSAGEDPCPDCAVQRTRTLTADNPYARADIPETRITHLPARMTIHRDELRRLNDSCRVPVPPHGPCRCALPQYTPGPTVTLVARGGGWNVVEPSPAAAGSSVRIASQPGDDTRIGGARLADLNRQAAASAWLHRSVAAFTSVPKSLATVRSRG
jgi:hypothetical protein